MNRTRKLIEKGRAKNEIDQLTIDERRVCIIVFIKERGCQSKDNHRTNLMVTFMQVKSCVYFLGQNEKVSLFLMNPNNIIADQKHKCIIQSKEPKKTQDPSRKRVHSSVQRGMKTH